MLVKGKPWAAGVYTIHVNFNAICYKRMKHAMEMMLKDETTMSSAVFNTILGRPDGEKKLKKVRKPDDLDVHGLHTLNMSQQRAIYSALDSPFALIQGPPGTGKTQTAASLVYHMSKIHHAQILVVAPSNTAVDNLAVRIEKSGLKVVRVFARSREGLDTVADHLGLHTLVRNVAQHNSELLKWLKLKDEVGFLSEKDHKQYMKHLDMAEQDILASADVVCTTCIAAADRRLNIYRFKHVLVDEATQAVEPETIIPMVCGSKQVVLVGDHCQMGPVVESKQVELAGLGRSMFERLVLAGTPCSRLEVQYRMHPFIARFSNKYFYEGALEDGVTAMDRKPNGEFPWPNTERPSIFWNCRDGSAEEIGSNGSSFLNRAEGDLVIQALSVLLGKRKVDPKDVGVITPYNAQKFHLMDSIERVHGSASPLGRVEIASVDSFQGREKDFIILTCVRSSDTQGIGFLSSWQRLNVALTRAKKGVIVIGNADNLVKSMVWKRLVEHYLAFGVCVEGPINRLVHSHVTIPEETPESAAEAAKIGPARPRVPGGRRNR